MDPKNLSEFWLSFDADFNGPVQSNNTRFQVQNCFSVNHTMLPAPATLIHQSFYLRLSRLPYYDIS